jgi:thiol:disulfide interchange protein/plastocyanin
MDRSRFRNSLSSKFAVMTSNRIVFALVSITLLGCVNPSRADGAKPTKKDTPLALKSKNVVFTASVEPAEAKPGDTVTFKVTAKLDPGFHVYKHSKTQGPGPINTTFDFFDPAGLKTEGDWAASKEPVKHKDPNFAELDSVEYHEEEVTWSIKLEIPEWTEPGKKSLLCQARYQVCDAKLCSIPGQWTLPAAVLTVVPADGKGEPKLGTAPQPARPDTNLALQPKNAALTTSVKPANAKPGDTVTFMVTATLKPGFHIYKYSKSKEQGPGPANTNFDFFDPAMLRIEGDWTASSPPEKHKDPTFTDVDFVEYHENEVTWSIKLKVPDSATPGKRTLRCQARYMICDAKQCSMLGQWTLPEAVLTVLSADEKRPEATVAARPAETTPAANAPTRKSDQRPEVATADGPKSADSAGTKSVTATNVPARDKSSDPPAGPAFQSEIAQKAQQGLIPFLIASALGGLFALVMPCVWPMVPITVNFFVKQGQGTGGRSRATGLAITYCLSIIGIFTLVGVFFSFFFSASSLQTLANNPWLNLCVAGLFVAFGLSLLGMFELRLPSFLLNASSHGESRGGLIGVVFMALTLTITSFTCTFPVVGGLLVMAAGGNFFYPIVGLATFATVIALPFFLLALSPGLISKMPRSGDWMNAVKVVGGLVEIGAAFKFINTAELARVTPENAWFDAQVVLTSWVVLSVVCGIYLLGLFRTDHDHDEVKVGPGRMLCGSLFLALALFMAPALFGHVPRSMVWNRLIVGILPPDSSEFGAGVQLANGGDPSLKEVRATSTDPAQAEREEKRAHGVLWGMSFDQARELAAAQNKPILIDFTGVNCSNCRTMEAGVFPLPEVVSLLKKFVTVQLYTDFVPINSITADQREELAGHNQERILELAHDNSNPNYVVLTPGGAVLAVKGGLIEPPVFVEFLTRALEKLPVDVKVTRAEGSSEAR